MSEPTIIEPWYNSSSANDGSCVDTQFWSNGDVEVRNSKSPDTVIRFTKKEWDAFTTGVKAERHDSIV